MIGLVWFRSFLTGLILNEIVFFFPDFETSENTNPCINTIEKLPKPKPNPLNEWLKILDD